MKTFIITKDHIFDPEYDSEPATTKLPDCFERKDGLIDFRLYDDDGILYFEGFAPEQYLADAFMWGAFYAGTTRLDAQFDKIGEYTVVFG